MGNRLCATLQHIEESTNNNNKMHLLTDERGALTCAHCGRVFDRHPDLERREEREAQIRAVADDDRAARLAHFHRAGLAESEAMARHWCEPWGLHGAAIGAVRFEGVSLSLCPGVDTATAMAFVDREVLPMLRRSLLETLDGTQAELAAASRALLSSMRSTARDATLWCPSEPPTAELYPYGYTRAPDGTVVANPPPPSVAEEDPFESQSHDDIIFTRITSSSTPAGPDTAPAAPR